MAARIVAAAIGVGVAAAAGVAASYVYRKERKASAASQDHAAKELPMQPLPGMAGAPETCAGPAPTSAASADLAAVLKGNEALFAEKELALVGMLLEEGQQHLFSSWPPAGDHDADKMRLLQQIVLLDDSYHGGLQEYIRNAKQLLADSREGRNAFDGYVPSVPEGERLDFGSGRFLTLEQSGLAAAGASAFVLVAGGLGERLGYQGIKVALPSESATGTCFLELYCQTILALQEASGAAAAGRVLPLAIMTSDDTHARTEALLQQHSFFGMQPGQITLIKQEKVPCLIDNDAHLALETGDQYAIQTKPHGHGDVHGLLHRSGLAKAWQQQGLKWVCFFQDTNALVFRALLAALGLSAENDYDMNSLAVPRKAKEAIGAIARLTKADGSGAMTVNVEYNQLDPLLRSTINTAGDVNDASGWSPFPGNINQLVLKLSTYVKQLERTGGNISEFVNPKYRDATKTAFKSSTRLECMMQDYPKSLPADATVGFTVINQVWATYSPVKNSPADARIKAAEGNPTHSATTGEMDIYKANCEALMLMSEADVGQPLEGMFNGIPVEEWPRVVLTPSFACTLADVKSKVSSGGLLLAPRSVLVLEGKDIAVKNLRVDGALVVKAAPGAQVVLDGLSVSNAGWTWAPLDKVSEPSPEELIRGFRVVRDDTLELVFDQPGKYVVPEVAAPVPAAADAGQGNQAAGGTGDAAVGAGPPSNGGSPEPDAATSVTAASTQCDVSDSTIGDGADHDTAAAAAAAVAAKAVQAVLSQGK